MREKCGQFEGKMRLAHFLRRRRRRRRRRAVPAGDVRTPQNLGLSQNRATGTLNENPNAVHKHSDSNNSPDDLKISTEWMFVLRRTSLL